MLKQNPFISSDYLDKKLMKDFENSAKELLSEVEEISTFNTGSLSKIKDRATNRKLKEEKPKINPMLWSFTRPLKMIIAMNHVYYGAPRYGW